MPRSIEELRTLLPQTVDPYWANYVATHPEVNPVLPWAGVSWQDYVAAHPDADPATIAQIEASTDNPAAYVSFLEAHPGTLQSASAYEAARTEADAGALGSGGVVGDWWERMNFGENVEGAVQNPLSFSTGGLLGGESGVATFDSGGAGVKDTSLTGWLSNQNVRAGLIAGGALYAGGGFGGGGGEAGLWAPSAGVETYGTGTGAAGAAGAGAAGAAGAAGSGSGAGAALGGAAAGGIDLGGAIGAGLGTAASLYTGEQTAAAAEDAALLQQAAADKATAELARQFDIAQANQAPWLTSGQQALAQQGALMGLSGDTEAAMAALQAAPGYQFRLSQGQKGLEASSAARGGMGSGKAMTGALDWNQNFASNEYMNRFNQLDRMAGAGQATATGMAQQGANYGANQGNLWTGSANQQAAATLAANQARQSGLVGATNWLSNYLAS